MHLTVNPGRTRKAAHARAASHPCHCDQHPALARLDGGVRELRSWAASGGVADGGSSGLALVEAVLAALGELLELPQAVAALHGGAALAACDGALDGFLVLADAYGTFGSALLALKESVAGLRGGARRGDGDTVAASLRARRRTEKELCRLAASMRHASRPAEATGNDVAYVMAEAAAAISAASEAIFSWCAAMSPADMSSSMAKTSPSSKWLPRLSLRVMPAAKKVLPETATATATALERLEDCIGELESGSEKVFRRLLQTRVSLLNIHNPL
ncbi:hypothetical protein ABZP36_011188 [Zizania latifolia]